jgi:DNA-binding CsgD family transcriptional regulator
MQLHGRRLEVAYQLGRRDEVDATRVGAPVLTERAGSYHAAWLSGNTAQLCYWYGDWDEALLPASLPALDMTTAYLPRAMHQVAALIALRREQPELAKVHIEEAGVVGPLGQPSDTIGVAPDDLPTRYELLALQAEISGDADRALQWRKKWLGLPLPTRQIHSQGASQLVRAALAVGDTTTAQLAVAACPVDPDASPAVQLTAEFCHALLDDDAEELLTLAENCRQFGWVLLRALILEEAAVRLAQAGDTGSARTALTDTVRIYDGFGASWDIRRTAARLRPYGIRRGPNSVHRRATSGWEALTPSETRVAHLVARGMSNPDIANELFLSRNTVQTHVSKVLAKLKLRSRIQLIHLVAAHASADSPDTSRTSDDGGHSTNRPGKPASPPGP